MSIMRYVLVLLLVASGAVEAMSWDRLSVKQLFGSADIVAYVEIVGGEKVTVGETNCRARYKARVIRGFKGDEAETFGFAYTTGPAGLEIEGRYILFLTNESKEDSGSAAADVPDAEARAEFRRTCATLLRGPRPIPAYGVVKVGHSFLLGELAVEVPDRYIAFPAALKRTRDDFGSGLELFDTVWIGLNDALDYLGTLEDEQ
jgi:hypothetical protein